MERWLTDVLQCMSLRHCSNPTFVVIRIFISKWFTIWLGFSASKSMSALRADHFMSKNELLGLGFSAQPRASRPCLVASASLFAYSYNLELEDCFDDTEGPQGSVVAQTHYLMSRCTIPLPHAFEQQAFMHPIPSQLPSTQPFLCELSSMTTTSR
jgi:hypothetical protein